MGVFDKPLWNAVNKVPEAHPTATMTPAELIEYYEKLELELNKKGN